ncbi:regulator of MON1-CCZ1 complex-like isoform X2 [Ptychodera flava]|uniref:regulator of MON1-CCZ1 complex-like isoform X2 n=1 Tax=Ptychodera flava TaxID=63121 RepID=UPI00396A253F
MCLTLLKMADEESYYIELSQNPTRFEPISKVTNVFFDEVNKQVFAVRSRGATGVVVKGSDEKSTTSFRMEDKGDVISIKFSYDMKVLAVQRSHKTVEFINFLDGCDSKEYSQSCKGKSTRIIGFNWTNINEIVFITDHGLEFYQPESSLLLLSSTTLGNVLHPVYFKGGTLLRLPKFEVDVPVVPKPPKLCLLERDVTMSNIYGQVYIIVLRHQQRGLANMGAEVVLYQLQRESPAKRTDVLRLNMSGRFALNVVDNLIVVHHQASKTTMIFDIKLGGESHDSYVTYHHPVLSPLPIKPFRLKVTGLPNTAQATQITCELYSPNWIVFQPNIVIDAKLGCMWHVLLRLEPMITMIPDKCRLIDFLLLRSECKMVILSVCKQALVPGHQCNLSTISAIFDKLNQVYRNYLEQESQGFQAGEPGVVRSGRKRNQAVVDQSDMYTHVFSVFVDNKDVKHKFIVAVLMEYIRSLNQYQIPVQHYLYELVINTLVQNNFFYQLHQFLQYHVLSDSKPLACLMLSLESVYPPAHQLALDMLKRLSTANEEIIEVLLSKHQVLTALRFIRSIGQVDTVSARKFLEAAVTTEDKMLFYTVFKFFEERNLRLRGHPRFVSGEHCEQYARHFEDLFGSESFMMPAVF